MIVRTLHKYALFFAILAGLVAPTLILPDEAPWWQAFAVGLPVTLLIYFGLFRYGVTRGTGTRR